MTALYWLRRERNQWKVIALLWLIILTTPFLFREAGRLFLPASLWYELRLVEVTDSVTRTGERIINVDREIYRPFYGQWTTTEELLTIDGFTTVRRCQGEANYRPDKALPDPVTLEWWTDLKTPEALARGEAPSCEFFRPFNFQNTLPDGSYRLCTTVLVRTENYGSKREQLCSDVYRNPIPEPRIIIREF